MSRLTKVGVSMRINYFFSMLTGLFLCLFATSLLAGERIGFEAEHVLEAPMNARYLALPSIPDELNAPVFRLQTGFNQVSASLFGADTLMLGAEYYLPASAQAGYLLSFFVDLMQINGENGATTFDPVFLDKQLFTQSTQVNVTDVQGHAEHYGVTVSRVDRLTENHFWQYGMVFEYYDVGQFAVSFDTTSLASNFSAVVDYAETYIAFTPFTTLQHKFHFSNSRHRYAARILAAWPLPRQGFSGRLTFNGFDQAGNTDDAGNGKHIPDPYVGLGFSISSPRYHWQLDIGASVYFFVTEGLIHKGINNPLFLNVTWQL